MSLIKSLCFLILINHVYSAKILMVYQIFGTSHYILGSSIAKALVKAGHEVTFVSPFEEKNPPQGPGKWNAVVLTGFMEERKKNEKFQNFFESRNIHPLRTLLWMNLLGNTLTEKTLSHPNFQKLLHSDQKFDLVVIEQFCNDALKALAPHFDAPLVLVSSLGANTWLNDLVANPAPPSYVSELLLSYSSQMNFYERLKNTLYRIASVLNHHLLFYPSQKKLMQKYFPNAPDFYDVLYNTSIILLNSHISTHQTKPHVPSMIEVGGFHIQPLKNLTGDIKEFMDSAKEGVIYFSMGSTLKAADMPENTRKAILKALSKVPQKVLWKWEDDNLPDQPSNVKISKWWPQQDILAHPNLKLFITHGGLLSTTETIYHGVPVLTLPVFGDQELNAAQNVMSGIGLTVNFYEITEEKLSKALNDLLYNPKYSKNAKLRSKIFHDRPVKPMDSVIYWMEYVIRHRGAAHLKVAGIDLTWYQYLLIDVFLVLFALIIILYIVLKFIIFKACSKIFCKKHKNVKIKKH